jgi:hypothetical protein
MKKPPFRRSRKSVIAKQKISRSAQNRMIHYKLRRTAKSRAGQRIPLPFVIF